MTMLPPRGLPPAAGAGVPPAAGAGAGGPPPQMLQAIMRMLPPQVVQQVAQNPAIIPQLIQRFAPMLLGAMGGGGGGPPVPPGAGGTPPMPPRRPMPPQFARRGGMGGGGMGGPPPGAFSGNTPPQPSSQGSIQPMSTEDELAEAQQNMGKKPKGGY